MSSSLFSYCLVSLLTVMSPGPAVLFTVSNAIHRSYFQALKGFIGVALGIVLVGLGASWIVVELGSTVPKAYAGISLFGGGYFLWLARKNWETAVAISPEISEGSDCRKAGEFLTGVLISITNPKALTFFILIYPLYIEPDTNGYMQYIMLCLIFSFNVILVHSVYASIVKNIIKTKPGELNKVVRLSSFVYAFLSVYSFEMAYEVITGTF